MKKIGFLFATTIMIIVFTFSANAETTEDGFVYSISNNQVTITGYSGTKTDIIIPSEIDGYPVKAIGNYAFQYNDRITSVIISDTVKTIGNSAFYSCDSLANVVISDSVYFIDYHAFAFSPVYKISLGKGLETISHWAFYCTRIKNLIIPDSVTSIGSHAFDGCNIDSVKIPENVIGIGTEAFNCTNLKSIMVDENNKYFSSDSSGVLFNKDKTTLICYPRGSKLTSYNIPESVTIINEKAFYYSKLQSVIMYDNVTSIGEYAFSYSSIETIKISEKLRLLPDGLFKNCSKLKEIVIPNSVSNVGWHVFEDCSNLSKVEIGTGITNLSYCMFFNCDSLTNVTVPSNVKSIGSWTFRSCDNLTSIYIPKSITGIGEYAFLYTGLSKVYYYGNKDEWNQISIASNNERLTSAKIYYNFDPTKKIVVFSSDPSFTIKTGESMWLGFGLCNEFGYIEEDWRKMSVVFSDPTILSLSEYTITDYGYSLEVIAKKQGTTTLTISDTENGLSQIIRVIVTDTYSKTYSYAIDDMVEFYPQNSWEDDILTNIYNLNGIFVNNYCCQKTENGYTVTFDAYNSKYFNGAVDVYDADGNWKKSKKIEKYSDISSFSDVLVQGFYLVSDVFTGNMFSYEQASYSKHTEIEIEVPEGGYFTISNNMSKSIGTFLYNSFEVLFKGVSKAIELTTSDSDEIYLANFTKLFEDKIKETPALREALMEKFLDTAESEIEKISENILEGDVDNAFCSLAELLENLLNSLDISWKHLFKSSIGYGEKLFTTFSGPAGTALKSIFAITEGTSDMLFAIQMAKSLDEPYATVYSSLDTGYVNPYGIVVTENNNVDKEAVLQVFKVTDNGDFDDEISELYNICFVKNDELVQPTGKVKVYIPIPENMIASTCRIYRQESDNTWTSLIATIEGNYLVFETDHFSLYAITGDKKEMGILTQPKVLQYKKGDNLNTDELSLILGDGIVSSGFVCKPTVLSNCGEEIITVKYKGLSTSFTVWVNHTYITEIKAPATHTKEGVLTYTCSECGDSYTDKIDKTTEHTYNEMFIAPSCTETGYTVYTCECGDTYISDYISETGHSDNNNDGTCDGCGIKLSTTDNENCSCNCHKSGLMGIIWKILRFFYKLFKTNPVCGCGVSHY